MPDRFNLLVRRVLSNRFNLLVRRVSLARRFAADTVAAVHNVNVNVGNSGGSGDVPGVRRFGARRFFRSKIDFLRRELIVARRRDAQIDAADRSERSEPKVVLRLRFDERRARFDPQRLRRVPLKINENPRFAVRRERPPNDRRRSRDDRRALRNSAISVKDVNFAEFVVFPFPTEFGGNRDRFARRDRFRNENLRVADRSLFEPRRQRSIFRRMPEQVRPLLRERLFSKNVPDSGVERSVRRRKRRASAPGITDRTVRLDRFRASGQPAVERRSVKKARNVSAPVDARS